MHHTPPHAAPLLAILSGLMAPMVRADQGNERTSAEKIAFRFAPQPITFERRVTTQRTRTMSDGSQQLDESSGTETVHLARNAGGYRMRVEPSDLAMKRNGVMVNNGLMNTLQSLEYAYELDAEGRLQTVTGYETVPDLLNKMAASLPEATRQALQQAFSAEALNARERAEYRGRIEDFLGLEVAVGTVSTALGSYALPSGETIEFTNAIHFSGTETCGDTTCVAIDHFYNSDPTALPRVVTDLVESFPTPSNGALGETSMAIEGEAHRLIDPATMLIHRESLRRTILMTIEAPGQDPVTMTLTDQRDYAFSYPEANP